MTIIVDRNIPFARQAFGHYGEVMEMEGREITRGALRDVEGVVVRSVTRVDRELLEGTPVVFVGTATNGVDHVDLEYLRARKIVFAHAGGSNANSVAEYVIAALLALGVRRTIPIIGSSIGVVGVGSVGARLVRFVTALGMRVVAYDPPRSERDPLFTTADIDQVLNCDVVSLHVPLVDGGPYATRRMVDRTFLERLRPGALLINTSRGGVVASGDLLRWLQSNRGTAALDVWDGEPSVPQELIAAAALATPHIAGYSFDAKCAGTEMMAESLGRFLRIPPIWSRSQVVPTIPERFDIAQGSSLMFDVADVVRHAYDILDDDRDLRSLLALDPIAQRAGFDRLRRDYPLRREFSAFEVATPDATLSSILASLGFRVTG